jgi:hypothetical protein
MICFEKNTPYQLKGCSHLICEHCAERLRDKNSVQHPFSCNFTMTVDKGVNCIKCPYCRQREPTNFDMPKIIKKYKNDYYFWLELEMKFDGEQSVAKDIAMEYSFGKKRMVTTFFTAQKGASFARYYDDRTSRYRKMPFSKKDQWDQINLRFAKTFV